MSSSRNCSDPRDRVYGVLGIAPPIFASRIRPLYSASAAAVYKDTFRVHLDLVHRLELLQSCDLAGQQIESPSWVPNWAVRRTDSRVSGIHFASGCSSARARYLPLETLEVTGIQCAIVRNVSQSAPGNLVEALGIVRGWEPGRLRTAPYITGQSLLDAYASTLLANRLKERFPGLSEVSLQEWKDVLLTKLSTSAGLVDADIITDRDVFHALLGVRGRTLITTEEEYIGLGSIAAHPGDRVYVLIGCDAPILLRSVSSGNFQAVGNCYVHGLMDLESLLGHLPDLWKVRIEKDDLGLYYQHFSNSLSGEVTSEDPRLGSLPLEWERIQTDRTIDDLNTFRRSETKLPEK